MEWFFKILLFSSLKLTFIRSRFEYPVSSILGEQSRCGAQSRGYILYVLCDFCNFHDLCTFIL